MFMSCVRLLAPFRQVAGHVGNNLRTKWNQHTTQTLKTVPPKFEK